MSIVDTILLYKIMFLFEKLNLNKQKPIWKNYSDKLNLPNLQSIQYAQFYNIFVSYRNGKAVAHQIQTLFWKLLLAFISENCPKLDMSRKSNFQPLEKLLTNAES